MKIMLIPHGVPYLAPHPMCLCVHILQKYFGASLYRYIPPQKPYLHDADPPLTKKCATKPRKSTILGHFLKEFRDKGFLTQFWLLQAGPIFGRAYLRKYWELANDI